MTQSEQVEYLLDMASLENSETGEFWAALAQMLEICEYGNDDFVDAVRQEATETIGWIQSNYRVSQEELIKDTYIVKTLKYVGH
jgi:hypothetical protein